MVINHRRVMTDDRAIVEASLKSACLWLYNHRLFHIVFRLEVRVLLYLIMFERNLAR